MDTIQCKACNRNVVPRLWHIFSNSGIRHTKTQHICPFCGVVMFETGGGFTVAGKMVLFLALYFGLAVLATILAAMYGETGRYIGSAVLLLFLLYAVIRAFRKGRLLWQAWRAK